MASTLRINTPETITRPVVSQSDATPPPEATQQLGSSWVHETKEFLDIMLEFKIRYPVEPEARVEKWYSIRAKTSWEEVLKVLDNSATAYAKGKGLQRALKKTKGVMENRADTFEKISRIVPDVDYTKPILGAVIFILQVRSN